MNNENIHNFRLKQQETEIADAHKEALRANKAGKKLVKQTVRMAENGISSQSIRNPAIRIKEYFVKPGLDMESTTLALNAELKAQDHDIRATAKDITTGTVMDPGFLPTIEINEIDGEQIAQDSQK